jgi:SAM-dependent methyltransferase
MASTSTASPEYLFDNATSDAAVQTALLARILDQHTEAVFHHVLELHPRFRSLDLGCGRGTIAHLLADMTAPTGTVVAMDLDPRHVADHDRIDVRAVDVRTADLGVEEYDVVHARLFAMHLPEREQLIRRAVDALKPGGCLITSDWDCTHPEDMFVHGPDDVRQVFDLFQRTLIELGVTRGMSAGWARQAPAVMLAAGLTNVASQVYNALWSGEEPGMLLHASNSRQLEQPLLDAGMTLPQLELLRDAMRDPNVHAYSYPMYTTVGWRHS